MTALIQTVLRLVTRMMQSRFRQGLRGDARAAGDRKGTPEARAKADSTVRNLMRNRRMLSVLRRL